MKILMTGGSGVVGAAALPALQAAGHEIRLLSRHADEDVASFPAGVEAFTADVADPQQLAGAVHGCDVVLHIAGIVEEQPPDVTFEKVNVEGTRHLLEAAEQAGAPYFVFLSSLGADRGASEYHQSKLRAEAQVRTYAGPWTIVRPGSIYGPGDETISTLLKMIRVLPAVPMVAEGDQSFQPLWYQDFGHVLVQLVERGETFRSRTLEIAGTEVTTTDDVLARLADITGKNPPRVAVPAWLAQVGAQALEAFGATGQKLLRRAGFAAPINSAKLSMLIEGSVIPDPGQNAFVTEFDVTPTPLRQGLEQLADLLPEQLPGEGVGAIKQATYSAEIRGSGLSAVQLLDRVCERIGEVMPLEFAAEPGAPEQAREGATLTADIATRGHVQVRLEERTETRVTFVTLESHPLAAVLQLQTEEPAEGVVRFSVHTASQAANLLDWVAMKVAGDLMQEENWREVVRRVIRLSGGESAAGVQRIAHTMADREVRDLRVWVTRLVQRRHRRDRVEQVQAG